MEMPPLAMWSYETFKWSFMVFVLVVMEISYGLELEGCDEPLGMESGNIRDNLITASSAYDSSSVGAHHARLQNNRQGGAWCPRHMVSRDSREYLEVDLENIHVVTSIMTQGRYGNGQGQEYAEQYFVEYYRVGLKKWVRWKDRKGKELLAGNTDTSTINEQRLDPPIIGRKIRLFPYSDHVRTVCMRIEVLGCIFKDDLLSYFMPQGIRRGPDLDLSDRLYDGTEEAGYLSHGLGQLVDGQKGQDNFRLDLSGLGKGYEWVGWRNDTPDWSGMPLEMVFQFDHVRNFSAAHLHTNNQFTKEIQVFSHARAFLSLNGIKYSPEAVHFSYMPDLVMEHSRNVTIKLHNRIGKFLKLQLYFASRWILISEVSFTSVAAKGNFTSEAEAEGITEYDSLNLGRDFSIQRDEVKMTVGRNIIRQQSTLSETNQKRQEPKGYIGFVIAILTVIILVLVSAIVFIIFRNHRIKSHSINTHIDGKIAGGVENGKTLMEDIQKDSTTYTESSRSTMYDRHAPPSFEPNFDDSLEPPTKSYSLTPNHIEEIFKSTTFEPRAPPVPPPPRNYYSSGELYKTLLNLQRKEVGRMSPKIRKRASSSSTNPFLQDSDLEFENILEDFSHFNGINVITNIDHFVEIEDRTEKNVENVDVYIENDNDKNEFKNIIDHSGNVEIIKRITSDKLKLVENVGEGIFGEVNVCEISQTGFGDFRLVVVYKLNKTELFEQFKREVHTLSHLEDPNVSLLLGAHLDPTPSSNSEIIAVREYSPCGDLCQFLQDHVAESATPLIGSTASTLSYGCLIFMATQIASGMKYLESRSYVHKDLATRNCLVGPSHQIKISDLGSYKNIYNNDYCQISEKPRPIPIRWMAWESVLLEKYSNKTDVWSFGVLLWEVLTFAREQPFEELTDEGVIDNLREYYQNTEKNITLPIPFNCPREIYDLMLECWQRNESDRPSFREIHLFLQRKNLGYSSSKR